MTSAKSNEKKITTLHPETSLPITFFYDANTLHDVQYEDGESVELTEKVFEKFVSAAEFFDQSREMALGYFKSEVGDVLSCLGSLTSKVVAQRGNVSSDCQFISLRNALSEVENCVSSVNIQDAVPLYVSTRTSKDIEWNCQHLSLKDIRDEV